MIPSVEEINQWVADAIAEGRFTLDVCISPHDQLTIVQAGVITKQIGITLNQNYYVRTKDIPKLYARLLHRRSCGEHMFLGYCLITISNNYGWERCPCNADRYFTNKYGYPSYIHSWDEPDPKDCRSCLGCGYIPCRRGTSIEDGARFWSAYNYVRTSVGATTGNHTDEFLKKQMNDNLRSVFA